MMTHSEVILFSDIDHAHGYTEERSTNIHTHLAESLLCLQLTSLSLFRPQQSVPARHFWRLCGKLTVHAHNSPLRSQPLPQSLQSKDSGKSKRNRELSTNWYFTGANDKIILWLLANTPIWRASKRPSQSDKDLFMFLAVEPISPLLLTHPVLPCGSRICWTLLFQPSDVRGLGPEALG